MRHLFATKSLDQITRDSQSAGQALKRTLGPVQLTALGIGAIMGAGIFSTIGSAAAGGGTHLGAGPAIIASFVLTAVACGFAALCYAEFAAMVPISGSAYTYAYATLGELVAWIIGWDLILEYALGAATVAVGWSGYVVSFLRDFGIQFPAALSAAPGTVVTLADQTTVTAVFNLPAVLIAAAVTLLLVIGIQESANVNSVIVVVKVAVVLLVLVAGAAFVNRANWVPFIPPNQGEFGAFGWSGVARAAGVIFFGVVGAFYVQPANWVPFAPNGFAGISSAAAIIFFAYIGFDAVSTAAEETKNPQRDMPIGMIASLVICTVIYIAVAMVLTGMLPWRQLGTAEPLATAFSANGITWASGIIAFGAVCATSGVLLVFQLGQPRIFFSMARDGLLPRWAARVHPRFRTPHVTTILTGVIVAAFATFMNINEVVELTNIGTLFAFVLVSVGILVLRRTDPGRARPFRTPFVPWVPLVAIGMCVYLMLHLPLVTWIRFVVWLAAGAVIYLAYGVRHSVLRKRAEGAARLP